ncbi:ABC transporter [Paenibacillus terrae HPL-003]|uniref:ABC transporter n=1 Tax=Paenibacillus terrae (strain HPL-003) TaxID=985665 RepID=G7VYS3_PAETH|nr:ABC transporter ATP-binding protein [Paenibacillus terrae]AET59063.1 ABC transporter [Paenibacillus terrae HPL-003]
MSYMKKYIYKRKFQLLQVIFLLFLSVLLSTPGPYYIKIIMDKVLIEKRIDILFPLICFIIVVAILQVLLSITQSYFSSSFIQKMMIDMREDLYRHIYRLDYMTYIRIPRGEYLTRITNDIEVVGQTCTSVVLNVLINSLTIVIYIGVTMYLNWKLTLIGIITIPFFVITIQLLSRKLHGLSMQLQENKSAILTSLDEDFAGMKHIKLKQGFKERYGVYSLHIKNYAKIFIRVTVWSNFFTCLSSLIALLGPVSILIAGTYLVHQGKITIGSLLAFYGYIGALYQPVSQISIILPQLEVMKASLTRIKEVLLFPVKEYLVEEKDLLNKNSIVFRDVSFITQEGNPLLNCISFRIDQGQTIRLNGASGAGKTTILNLLLGIIRPTTGKIFYGDSDLCTFSTDQIARRFAFVSQDFFLFNGTIMENIIFGLVDVDTEKVYEVCEGCGLHNEIMAFPSQYDTLVGPHGISLSGGQTQRLMIVRALLQYPGVLILDEATSELDLKNESLIFQNLHQNYPDTIIIIVTHKVNHEMKISAEFNLENGRISHMSSTL